MSSPNLLEAFDAKRKLQETIATGCAKFAIKPKSGIEYFVSNGLVVMEAQALARFFLDHTNELDKTQLGKWLYLSMSSLCTFKLLFLYLI